VIVVDGGSTDVSAMVAIAHGATVIDGIRGRGWQLDLGGRRSTASWLLFLHADTRLDGRHWASASEGLRET